MNNATNFTANDRLRVIGAKALTGTFVKYYAARHDGIRRVEVRWDDRSYVMTFLETQLEKF